MHNVFQKIDKLTEQVGGVWGITIKHIQTGETWEKNSKIRFPAASVIKVPIMVALFAAWQKGQLQLCEQIVLRKEDQVGGSGVLQHMTPGTSLTIYDYITLMMIQSDNTATNILIDVVGVAAIQQLMKEMGLNDSSFYNKLMTIPVEREGNNEITAADMMNMLDLIVNGKVISYDACERMLAIMKKQQITDCLPARLPVQSDAIIGERPHWEFAHKTGSITNVLHDVGILYMESHTILLTVLSKDIDQRKSKRVMAEIGSMIYDAYTSGN